MATTDRTITTDAGIGRPPRRPRLKRFLTQMPISLRKNYRIVRNPEF